MILDKKDENFLKRLKQKIDEKNKKGVFFIEGDDKEKLQEILEKAESFDDILFITEYYQAAAEDKELYELVTEKAKQLIQDYKSDLQGHLPLPYIKDIDKKINTFNVMEVLKEKELQGNSINELEDDEEKFEGSMARYSKTPTQILEDFQQGQMHLELKDLDLVSEQELNSSRFKDTLRKSLVSSGEALKSGYNATIAGTKKAVVGTGNAIVVAGRTIGNVAGRVSQATAKKAKKLMKRKSKRKNESINILTGQRKEVKFDLDQCRALINQKLLKDFKCEIDYNLNSEGEQQVKMLKIISKKDNLTDKPCFVLTEKSLTCDANKDAEKVFSLIMQNIKAHNKGKIVKFNTPQCNKVIKSLKNAYPVNIIPNSGVNEEYINMLTKFNEKAKIKQAKYISKNPEIKSVPSSEKYRSENPEIKRVSSLEECLEHPQNKSLTFHKDPENPGNPLNPRLLTSGKPNPIFEEFQRAPKLSQEEHITRQNSTTSPHRK